MKRNLINIVATDGDVDVIDSTQQSNEIHLSDVETNTENTFCIQIKVVSFSRTFYYSPHLMHSPFNKKLVIVLYARI